MPTSLDELEALIRSRRTSLKIDPGRAVPPDTLERLLDAVTWAPNHKRTWPWRVAVIRGRGREQFAEAIARYETAKGADESRIARVKSKYIRSPVLVLFARARHEDPARHVEDRDAVVAGIQNFLLAATAAGLATHWATGGWLADSDLVRFAGLSPGDELIALVYLGWPIGDVPAPERPPLRITYIDG